MNRQQFRYVRIAVMAVVIVGVLIARNWKQPVDPPPQQQPENKAVVSHVTVRDQDGEVVLSGEVDLTETLARIDKGERLNQFRNDGSVFQNREGRLPKQSSGYYHEWVHPTPKLSGPGPQRVVTGSGTEAYYTPDHYNTFQKIR